MKTIKKLSQKDREHLVRVMNDGADSNGKITKWKARYYGEYLNGFNNSFELKDEYVGILGFVFFVIITLGYILYFVNF